MLASANSQGILTLDTIFSRISVNNPGLKSLDAQIRSLDEAAKGARNWEAPELSTGFWMTPYNPDLWKKQSSGATGQGQYMISAQQLFPNKKKLDSEQNYMQAMSATEKEKKSAELKRVK